MAAALGIGRTPAAWLSLATALHPTSALRVGTHRRFRAGGGTPLLHLGASWGPLRCRDWHRGCRPNHRGFSPLLVAAVRAVFAGLGWLRERRRDRRVVKVTCTEARGSDDDGSESHVLRVIATNEGHKSVEIVRVFFRTRAGRELPVPEGAEPRLPALLGDGASVTIDVLAELSDKPSCGWASLRRLCRSGCEWERVLDVPEGC